jgi:hypothetical protein
MAANEMANGVAYLNMKMAGVSMKMAKQHQPPAAGSAGVSQKLAARRRLRNMALAAKVINAMAVWHQPAISQLNKAASKAKSRMQCNG